MIELLGWLATAAFVGSYFCSNVTALRAMQMVGAVLWVIYGAIIDALPVVAANLLVLMAAASTSLRFRRSQ